MGFQVITADMPTVLAPKKHIKKFHINYKPSVKLKRKLKAVIPVTIEGIST